MLTIILLILVAVKPNTYIKKVKIPFNNTVANVGTFTNDINNLPNRIKKISKIKILDSTQNQVRFKIFTATNHWMILKNTIQSDSAKTLTFESSSFGYSGVWQYYIKNMGNDMCELHIEEKATIDNYFFKLIFFITGNDAFVEEEIRTLKISANEMQ